MKQGSVLKPIAGDLSLTKILHFATLSLHINSLISLINESYIQTRQGYCLQPGGFL